MTATLASGSRDAGASAAFRHEAAFYLGEDGFAATVLPFLTDAAEQEAPTLVVVSAPRIAMLRSAMGPDAGSISYADMATVGRNPARIIPAWRDFLDAHVGQGRPVRGVGEPIWAGRSPAEMIECQRHEALLNVAFADSPAWWLLCPYDVTELEADVLTEARRSHPYLRDESYETASDVYYGEASRQALGDAPLPEPSRCLESMEFRAGQLRIVRAVTGARAQQFGMDEDHAEGFVLAVHEVAANSVVHGGGAGSYRLWREGRSLVCEIRDSGAVDDPLVGRVRPDVDGQRGRGLWIANQICDLVQVRSQRAGSVVRLHRTLDA
jgi:anti-sigma regulatory factor (Ser/Thr protein kinase)